MLRLLSITTLALALFGTTIAHAQTPPPPWMPHQSADELLHRGHRNKVAGGVMMGVGSLLLAGSIALDVVAGAAHDSPYYVGSLGAFAVGLPILGGGIAAYAVGGYQMRKAHRLQLVGLAAAPTADGAAATVAFRF